MKGKLAIFFLLLAYSISYLISNSPIRPLSHTNKNQLPILAGDILSPDLIKNQIQVLKRINASVLKLSEFVGPECLEIDPEQKYLYTGLNDGRVVRIDLESMEAKVVTRIGQDLEGCGTEEFEHICGRPLGIALDGERLIVADAYLGIHSVDLKTGKKELLVDAYKGQKLTFSNDVVVHDGFIYFTMSSKHDRRDFGLDILEKAPYGMLFEYNIKAGKIQPVVDGFYFANGIELFDNDHVLVAETTMSRVTKVKIRGKGKGRKSTFAANLPCYPDNISHDEHDEIFWVGCGKARKYPFSLLDWLDDKPNIRKILAWFPKDLLLKLAPSYDILLALDSNGIITRSLHDPSGANSPISHITPTKDTLYLGSFKNPHITLIKK